MKPGRPRRVWFPDMEQRHNCKYYDHGACYWLKQQTTLNGRVVQEQQACQDVHYCDVVFRYRKGLKT